MNSEFSIAVHALVFLNHKGGTQSSDAIAKNVCTNPVRIRKVLSKLKKAGFVTTKEGENGGYSYSAKENNLNLSQVLEAVDVSIVYTNWHSGDKHMECLIASGMAGVIDNLCLELDNVCRSRLSLITILDLDKQIFGE